MKYYKLLAEKKEISHKITEEKRNMHEELVILEMGMFRLLDILVICCIVFNLGAVVLTNMMAMEAKPDMVVMEVNPYMAEQLDLEPHPEANQLYKSIITQAFFLGIMLFFYVNTRRTILTEAGLRWLITFVFFYLIFFAWDFFNDFGFFIGRLIF